MSALDTLKARAVEFEGLWMQEGPVWCLYQRPRRVKSGRVESGYIRELCYAYRLEPGRGINADEAAMLLTGGTLDDLREQRAVDSKADMAAIRGNQPAYLQTRLFEPKRDGLG